MVADDREMVVLPFGQKKRQHRDSDRAAEVAHDVEDCRAVGLLVVRQRSRGEGRQRRYHEGLPGGTNQLRPAKLLNAPIMRQKRIHKATHGEHEHPKGDHQAGVDRLMNGSLRHSSMIMKAGIKIAARIARCWIIGLPNHSLRSPSSSTVISEPSPIAMQRMPTQSPRRSRSSCIGSASSPYQTAQIRTSPGSRLM